MKRFVLTQGKSDARTSAIAKMRRLRREYLLRKSSAYALTAAATTMLLIGLWLGFGLFRDLITAGQWSGGPVGLVLLIGVVLVAGATTVFGTLCRKQLRSAGAMPHVPAVGAAGAPLPVEEALVRGSCEPLESQNAALLRAAAPGQEMQSNLLLRSSGDDKPPPC